MNATQQPNRESFAFLWTFKDAMSDLEDEEKLELYEAITDFAFFDVEPEFNSRVARAVFKSIRINLQRAKDRYDRCKRNGSKGAEYGKLGGRPKKKIEQIETPRITPSETPSETPKKPLNVNDNDNVNVNVNDNANDNANANVNVNDKDIGSDEPPHISKKPTKHHYGEYKHVLLTDDEYKKLVQERGQVKTEAAITFLDEYLEMNGKSYKSCYLALRKWVFDALEEKKTSTGQKAVNKVAQQLDSFYQMAMEWSRSDEEGTT